MMRNNQTYTYHADALGSILAITDSANTVVQRYRYDAWGNILEVQDPDFKQPFAYTGREWDEESGLYYYRARYYDAQIGRFLQSDPIGLKGGLNVYAYASAGPTSYNDPFGLVRWSGEMYAGSYTSLIGGGVYNFDLKSDCVNGKYAYVHVRAWGGGVGLGARLTGGAGPIEFKDGNIEPDPYAMALP